MAGFNIDEDYPFEMAPGDVPILPDGMTERGELYVLPNGKLLAPGAYLMEDGRMLIYEPAELEEIPDYDPEF